MNNEPVVKSLGVPVRSVNWVRLQEGIDGRGETCLFATMGQQADNLFLLKIDPVTGAFSQYPGVGGKSNYPTATCMSRTGMYYVGAAYSGRLLRYNPSLDTFEDLGEINPGNASFPCAIDEDATGVIWIGSYGTADLTSYDPSTGLFARHGRMDDTDMYNYPIVNADGMICCKIMMTRPHLVVFDPRTKEKRVVGPVSEKGKDSFTLIKGDDGCVYIVSSLGNYRVNGFEALPVETVPKADTSHPFGTLQAYRFTDSSAQLYRRLHVVDGNGESRHFDLDYHAAGSEIFSIHEGPDNRIYGSSILPLHLFAYDGSTGGMIDYGKCSASAGEAYSMANYKGILYISSYPQARLSVYDPARPYKYGAGEDGNPREIGRIDDTSYRPRTTLAGPNDRIWFASLPDYGLWGGLLTWYDPVTGAKGSYEGLAGEGSCYTLAWLEEQVLMAVGTTIHAGTGTRPKREKASLFLWDYEAEEKVWEGYPDSTVVSFNALVAGVGDTLYGSAITGDGSFMFGFNTDSCEFTWYAVPPEGRILDHGLRLDSEGNVFVFTTRCLYRFDPEAKTFAEMARDEEGIDVAGPITGKVAYYAQAHVLKSIRLP